jgi:hypothetical protein
VSGIGPSSETSGSFSTRGATSARKGDAAFVGRAAASDLAAGAGEPELLARDGWGTLGRAVASARPDGAVTPGMTSIERAGAGDDAAVGGELVVAGF